MGWGSGWVGALWGPGSLQCFSVGVCCCPSPLPSRPRLSTRICHSPSPPSPTSPSGFPIFYPKNVLSLSFCFVCCWFFLVLVSFIFFVSCFLVLFFFLFCSFVLKIFFLTILRSLCSRRNYYILLRKWGEKPRGHRAFIKKQNKVCTLFFRSCVSWVCVLLRSWGRLLE